VTAAQNTAPAAPALPSIEEPRNWISYASLAGSALLLVVVAWQLRGLDFAKIQAMVPTSVGFWAAFAVYYLAPPLCEWVIYRRLWTIPVTGIGPLLRKLVSNELLLGYLGEAQFYAWARQRTAMTTAPFGAIKDVTILSALTGNAVTLLLVIAVWPQLPSTAIGVELKPVILSLLIVLFSSLVILFFRRRLFSLAATDLRFITGVHALRIAINLSMAALMWHLVLPVVPFSLWMIMATVRMLISRLPLIPNKDIVFAGLAVVLLERDIEIGALMTMMAGIVLATHLAVGGVLGAVDLLQWRRTK
jgi:hypothetical protein